MKKVSKGRKLLSEVHCSFWLVIIIAVALVRLIYIFSLRDGHHVDETWSYGFANSYYSPNVFVEFDDRMFEVTGKWVDSEIFKDYITVASDERFSYDSVLFNKREDLSPPLYALLLHTLCSLFPNSFSWAYAFAISVVFFVPSLILVFKISLELTESKICGFVTLIYFVFSGCGTACFLYLRLYHMFTFFSFCLMWLLLRIYNSKDKHIYKYFFFLPFVTFLGTLTHYYFLILAFFLTFYTGIFLLLRKNIILAFRVCYVMLFSALLFFVLYPVSFIKLTPFFAGKNGTEGYSYPYSWELRVVFKHFFYGTVGFYIDFIIQDLITVLGLMTIAAVIVFLLAYLFRNEKWMHSLLGGLKKHCLRFVHYMCVFFKSMNSFLLIGLFSIVSYILIIPMSASLYKMGYVERYFFPVMAIFIIIYCVFAISFLKFFLDNIRIRKGFSEFAVIMFMFILVIQCYRSNFSVDSYRFSTMGESKLKTLVTNKDCYIYTDSIRDLNWFSPILCDANQIYIDYLYQYKNNAEHIFPKLEKDCLLLIVDSGFISQEQKEALENGEYFELIGFNRPKQLITVEEYVSEIENCTGNQYCCIEDFDTFIGTIKLYKCIY